MRSARGNLVLRPLTRDDLLFTVSLRNNPDTRKWFYDQRKVDLEGSRKWFAALNPETDWYFIGELDGKRVGLYAIYHIDWAEKKGECGSVMIMPEYRGTDLSLRMARQLFQIARKRGLKTLYGNGYLKNRRAQKQAAKIGFSVTEDPVHDRFQLFLDLEKCSPASNTDSAFPQVD